MESLRLYYKNFIVETLILLAVAVQIPSGIKLVANLRKGSESGVEKLQLWTGLYLAFFFVIHVGSVLVGRFILKLDTNFYYGTAGLNTFPFNLFFIPYYGIANLSFFGHVAAIHQQKMKRSFFSLTPQKQGKFILAFGFIITILMFYGLTNHFQGISLPENYKVLVGK